MLNKMATSNFSNYLAITTPAMLWSIFGPKLTGIMNLEVLLMPFYSA